MGNYSVPPEILAPKPKGTIVKKIKSGHYVYSHSQYKDEKTGERTLSNLNTENVKSFPQLKNTSFELKGQCISCTGGDPYRISSNVYAFPIRCL